MTHHHHHRSTPHHQAPRSTTEPRPTRGSESEWVGRASPPATTTTTTAHTTPKVDPSSTRTHTAQPPAKTYNAPHSTRHSVHPAEIQAARRPGGPPAPLRVCRGTPLAPAAPCLIRQGSPLLAAGSRPRRCTSPRIRFVPRRGRQAALSRAGDIGGRQHRCLLSAAGRRPPPLLSARRQPSLRAVWLPPEAGGCRPRCKPSRRSAALRAATSSAFRRVHPLASVPASGAAGLHAAQSKTQNARHQRRRTPGTTPRAGCGGRRPSACGLNARRRCPTPDVLRFASHSYRTPPAPWCPRARTPPRQAHEGGAWCGSLARPPKAAERLATAHHPPLPTRSHHRRGTTLVPLHPPSLSPPGSCTVGRASGPPLPHPLPSSPTPPSLPPETTKSPPAGWQVSPPTDTTTR